jgi:hypothetical protein
MIIKTIQKFIFSAFSILFIIVVLTSCGEINSPSSDDQGSVSHDGTNMTLEFPVPRFLADSSSVIDSLEAQATIGGGSSHRLDVDPSTNQISGTITEVPSGTYDLLITYFVPSSGNNVVLCSHSTQVTVSTGQITYVTIFSTDIDRNVDDDHDGYTNLAEVRIGTNPLDPSDIPICEDVDGVWDLTLEIDGTDCGEGSYTDYVTISFLQDGCDLVVPFDDTISLYGTINGNQITLSGSYPEDNGTTSTNINFTVSGNNITGSSYWTWSDGYESCSWSEQISGTRESPICEDVAGEWDLTLEIDGTDCDEGSYIDYVTITFLQDGCDLVVPIDDTSSLSGTIYGNQITLSGSYQEDNGTMTMNWNCTVSEDNITGMSSWTWSDDYDSCSLSIEISGTRRNINNIKPPSNLQATATSSSSINITWTDNSDNETGFKIERSSSCSSGFTQITTINGNTQDYTDTELSAAQFYCYRVRAYNSEVNSDYSNTTGVTTLATLTVIKSGSGSGKVIGNGIECGTDCTEDYISEASIELTAETNAYSTFAGWSGADSSSTNTCTVIMNNNKIVTATFNPTFSTKIIITDLPLTDSDGSYTLEWTCTGLASYPWYIHEDSDSSFSNPIKYLSYDSTPPYTYDFSDKAGGTYCYRVGLSPNGPFSEPACIVVQDECQISASSKTHGQQNSYPDGIGQSFTACQSGVIRSIQLEVMALNNSNARIELQTGTDPWPGSYSQNIILTPGKNVIQLQVPFEVENGGSYSFGIFPSTGDLSLWSAADSYVGGEAFFIVGSSRLGIAPSPDLVFDLKIE